MPTNHPTPCRLPHMGAAARLGREATLRGLVFPIITMVAHPHVQRDTADADVGQVIIVANHSSHLDCPAVLLALPGALRRRTVVAAAADRFYRTRTLAALTSSIFATIPVERHRPGAHTVDACAGLIRDGWSLLLFPEGTRSRDGEMSRVRRGAAAIALATGVPILPIGIAGLDAILPPGSALPRWGGSAICVGSPLRPERDDDVTDLTARTEDAIRALRARAASSRASRPQCAVAA